MIGITRQAHHQMIKRIEEILIKRSLYVGLIQQTRELHPGMGLRSIYYLNKPEHIGRDAFISLGISEGYMLRSPRPYIQTTHSAPHLQYKNLLVGKEFTDVNQIWSSDITYFIVGKDTYYLVFIMDVYSRRILGYSASQNLHAVNNLIALGRAIQNRSNQDLNGLIHHSDKGSQYTSHAYTNMLDEQKILISMCNSVFENTHIERVHGTIKNDYLKYWQNSTLAQVKDNLKKAVFTYNHLRPHTSLEGLTPVEFEEFLMDVPISQRQILRIHTTEKSLTENILSNQLIMNFEGYNY